MDDERIALNDVGRRVVDSRKEFFTAAAASCKFIRPGQNVLAICVVKGRVENKLSWIFSGWEAKKKFQ